MSVEKSAISKIRARVVWPIVLLFLLNSLDRVNVSFAALQMNADLGFSPEAYGFGVGIFFAGYILLQMPSTLLLRRIGARWWLFAVVLFWGSIATAMAFMHDATTFYVLRFLLGVAEGGFAPGFIYLMGLWVPKRYRASAIAVSMLAIPISVIIGGPLSGWLMTLNNPMGMAGWRWMFLVEGLPTVVLAFVALAVFVNRPRDAKWLSGDEKAWLSDELAKDEAATGPKAASSVLAAILSWRTWAAATVWFASLAGAYALIFWLPQLIQQVSGHDEMTVAVLSALPWVAIGTGMIVNSWHSDKTQERLWHIGGGLLLAAAGIGAGLLFGNGVIAFILLIIGGFGLGSAQGVFWSLPTTFLKGPAAQGGITVINMIGNCAGLLVPMVIGVIRQTTGSFESVVGALAVVLLIGALPLLLLGRTGSPGVGPTQLSPKDTPA
ncbi:MFS transporter [soil metagenome]